jgi:uncharacterized protein YbjQ (UPF0145 family)
VPTTWKPSGVPQPGGRFQETLTYPPEKDGVKVAVTFTCYAEGIEAGVASASGSRSTTAEDEMLITTANDFPGHEIDRVLGEVFGLTVRSRNVGSQIGATLKSLFGGELQGMTTMLAQGRQQAIERLIDEATARGGNAIVAMRFDTSELGGTWTEICAYGTAVVARGL